MANTSGATFAQFLQPVKGFLISHSKTYKYNRY